MQKYFNLTYESVKEYNLIEVGSGQGLLSQYFAQYFTEQQYIQNNKEQLNKIYQQTGKKQLYIENNDKNIQNIISIDLKTSIRCKKDRFLSLTRFKIQRVKSDIRYYFPDRNNQKFLVFGKHFCGNATDILLSRIDLFKNGTVSLCCHCKSDGQDYPYKNWLENIFKQNQVENYDIKQLMKFTNYEMSKNNPQNLNSEDKYIYYASKMARCIIDLGRYLYLKENNLNPKIVKYCSEQVTKQNILLQWKEKI